MPYYHIRIAQKGRAKDAIELNLSEKDLTSLILEKYRLREMFACGGELVNPTDVLAMKITESAKPLALDHPDYYKLEYKDLWRRVEEQKDVTEKFVTFHNLAASSRRKKPRIPSSSRTKVLVRCGGRCEKCGIGLGDLVPDIHHIDGNPQNNEPSNLIVLCPNCHRKADRLTEVSSEHSVLFVGGEGKLDLEKLVANINTLGELIEPETRFILIEKIRHQTTDLPCDGMPHQIRKAITQLLLALRREIENPKMRKICLDILRIVNTKRDIQVNAMIKELFLSWIEKHYQDLTIEEKGYAMDVRQRLYEHNPDLLKELMLGAIEKWSPDEFEKLHKEIEFDRLDKEHIGNFRVLLWRLREEAKQKQLDEKVQRVDKLLGLYVFQ